MDDYEECGTCGFDHAYDGIYPGVQKQINEAHRAEKKSSNKVDKTEVEE